MATRPWPSGSHPSSLARDRTVLTGTEDCCPHPQPGRPGLTNSFDLIFRGLELITGGQRLHRYEEYAAALAAQGLSEEPFGGHLDAFRYGMPPHGGCALGLERWVARLADVPNVRETTLFPRDLTRLTP